jgi:hypothetical protein
MYCPFTENDDGFIVLLNEFQQVITALQSVLLDHADLTSSTIGEVLLTLRSSSKVGSVSC